MVGACSTTPPPRQQTLSLPAANLMTKAPPLYTVSDEVKVTPQESIEVVAKNYGLYSEVADRLHKLQDWVRQRLTN